MATDLILATEIIPPSVDNAGISNLSGATTDYQLMDAWLRDSQRSVHTLQMYRRVGEQLLAFLSHGLRGATLADIHRFEDHLRGRMGSSSVHTCMAVVRSFFGFAMRCDYIGKSPAHVNKVRTPPRARTNKVLTDDEVLALIQHARGGRDKLIIEVLLTSGMRLAEMLTLQWQHVRFDGGHALLAVLGKGSRVRHLKLGLGVSGRLLKLKGLDAADEDAVFTAAAAAAHPRPPLARQTVQTMIREAARRAGITKDVSPHWFRHTYATMADRKGKPTTAIRDTLGHTNLNTTMGYVAPYSGVLLSGDFITEETDHHE